ncbi:hypothetical protein BpHYR1_031140 [Brachionus plicatilis]|uniref:Uncharacterized protein n=1 Tax=Brachionus plicatilis TaxID=10195 RepID=A0A3M7QE13_BRAPC|nr:hypothetical protein BpHYR1_031140 [Brachionus plicatilis]
MEIFYFFKPSTNKIQKRKRGRPKKSNNERQQPSKRLLFPRIKNNTFSAHGKNYFFRAWKIILIYGKIKVIINSQLIKRDFQKIILATEALKTEENQIAFAYHGKISVPYRLHWYDPRYYVCGRKKTKKCVAYSGDVSDSDSEEEEIYDDASDEDESVVHIEKVDFVLQIDLTNGDTINGTHSTKPVDANCSFHDYILSDFFRASKIIRKNLAYRYFC